MLTSFSPPEGIYFSQKYKKEKNPSANMCSPNITDNVRQYSFYLENTNRVNFVSIEIVLFYRRISNFSIKVN